MPSIQTLLDPADKGTDMAPPKKAPAKKKAAPKKAAAKKRTSQPQVKMDPPIWPPSAKKEAPKKAAAKSTAKKTTPAPKKTAAKKSAPTKASSVKYAEPESGRAGTILPPTPDQIHTIQYEAAHNGQQPKSLEPAAKSSKGSTPESAEQKKLAKEKAALAKEQKQLNQEKTYETQEQQAIQQNPLTQAVDALANADTAEANQAEAMMGPAAATAGIAQADTQALNDVGGGSAAASWFGAQTAAAAANDSPLMSAMSAYQTAYQGTQPAVTTALQDEGAANALAMSVAPESDYLNLLSNHLGNTDYLSLSGSQAQGLPPALSYYLNNAQVGGVGKNSGAIPSAGAILSGGTSGTSTPPAVAPAVNPTAPS